MEQHGERTAEAVAGDEQLRFLAGSDVRDGGEHLLADFAEDIREAAMKLSRNIGQRALMVVHVGQLAALMGSVPRKATTTISPRRATNP